MNIVIEGRRSFRCKWFVQQTLANLLHRTVGFAAGIGAANRAIVCRNGCLPFRFQPDK
jgi:hypothetical protein